MLCFKTAYEGPAYRGIQVTCGIKEYITGRVSERYHDVYGARNIAKRFSALSHTEFEDMAANLKLQRGYEEYGVAETLAECFLEDYDQAVFPYVAARDSKNPRDSPAGADLVGFFYAEKGTCFLFGEVKLSHEFRHPPTIVTKRTKGLLDQLRSISFDEKRNNLIIWLAQKVLNTKYKNDYYRAWKLYNKNIYEFKTMGVLIRTTMPDPRDLEAPLDRLNREIKSKYFEVIAIYISKDDLVLLKKNGGSMNH